MDKSSPILITGSGGFVGRNLCETLKTAGCTELLCFEKGDTPETLAEYCRRAAFVVHLAGINRPKDPSEFYTGNAGLTETLLADLEAAGNKAPVLVTSSTQAALDNGIPQRMISCHTGEIEGYMIEGHVPVADIRRLLAERPDAVGLAVPDMPYGSPGMGPEDQREAYDVFLIRRDGSSEVFMSYSAA